MLPPPPRYPPSNPLEPVNMVRYMAKETKPVDGIKVANQITLK